MSSFLHHPVGELWFRFRIRFLYLSHVLFRNWSQFVIELDYWCICLVVVSLVVSISAVDCPGRLVSGMTMCRVGR